MMHTSRIRLGCRFLVAALLAATCQALLGAQPAAAASTTITDALGDYTQPGEPSAPVDIEQVEVTHSDTEVTVVTTLVKDDGKLGTVDTMLDTDGDEDAEYVQHWTLTVARTSTWEDDSYGSTACRLTTGLRVMGDRYVLTASTKRSCIEDPGQVRVWTLASGASGFSDRQDASAGSPPTGAYDFTWSDPVAADPPAPEPEPAATHTGLRVPHDTVRKGHPVTVRVTLRSDDGRPRGKVLLKHRHRTLKTFRMRRGWQWVRITGLRPRSYRVRAIYVGNDRFARSASRAVKVVVKRR